MAKDPAPDEIIELADARADARRARDWATADELKARIEASGWRVIDAASLYTLERAAPPDLEQDGIVRYGSSASVPSRLDEPPNGTASVVLVATDWPEDLARALHSLAGSPAGTQLVIVANAPSDAQSAALAGIGTGGDGAPILPTEIVWTRTRLGAAAAVNVGIRRASAPVVVVMDTSVEPRGDLVSAMVAALDDPAVAVAGPFGLVSGDLRRFEEAGEGVDDVVAIDGRAMGFRRADYVAKGPLDEHFVFFRNLDVWWSLVLRDQAEGDADDAPPRRARRLVGIPVARHVHRDWEHMPAADRERLGRRNFYRVLKRFATRRDMLPGG